MHSSSRRFTSWLFTLGLLLAIAPGIAAVAQTDERCFGETGLCISGQVRAFWEQHGGIEVFGLPITPQQEEPVDPDPEATGGRHAVLERAQEVLVEGVHLVAQHLLHLLLQLELRPLLVGVGELAERGHELDPGRDEVEVLGEPRVLAVRTSER